ncbi:hypothetical protein BD779DRAFT_1476326 [Infundibulicybe gibba]|nr:hypothetical protein BD779DRAFT_1476326 [Infundibulicybe gibba]
MSQSTSPIVFSEDTVAIVHTQTSEIGICTELPPGPQAVIGDGRNQCSFLHDGRMLDIVWLLCCLGRVTKYAQARTPFTKTTLPVVVIQSYPPLSSLLLVTIGNRVQSSGVGGSREEYLQIRGRRADNVAECRAIPGWRAQNAYPDIASLLLTHCNE